MKMNEERRERRKEKTNCYTDVLHPDSTLSHSMLCAGLSTTSLRAESPLGTSLTDLIEYGLICTLLFSL